MAIIIVQGPFLFRDSKFIYLVNIVFGQGVAAGYLCRKLAFPDLTEEEYMAQANPPPPTMFPK